MSSTDRISTTSVPLLAGPILAVAFFAIGCDSPDIDAEYVRQQYARFVELPEARRSADMRLRAEIDRIFEEGETPAQLQRSPPPDAQNVASALRALFDQDSLKATRSRTDKLIPDGRFTFDRLRLESVLQFTQEHRDLLEAIDAALKRPACDFGVDFRHGYSAKTEFIDLVEVCVYVKALEAAGPLGEGDPIDAILALHSMFRLVELLAEVPHVSSRLAAVPLRRTTFRVVEATSHHSQLQHSDLVTLYAMVRQCLEKWPSDAIAWVGDRAMVLHSYEMIRAGLLTDLLTEEELAPFVREGTLKDLVIAIRKSVDDDERYYLASMRTIIDACREPYHHRKAVFGALQQDLDAKNDSSDFPLAAAHLFLADVQQGQKLQAQDRALAESWALALALAADLDPPKTQLNPVSGRPYLVTREPTRVTVWTGEPNDAQIVVPRPSSAAVLTRPLTDR